MLSMDVLRLITVQALRDKTWALGRVYDSPSTATDVRLEHDNEPFIAVYVDDADLNPAPENFGDELISLLEADDTVRLIIEVAVGSPRTTDDAETEDRPDMGGVSRINATDPALELQMGLVARQAMQALLSTNPNNPWSELWRLWVFRHKKTEVRRGGPGQEATPGVRFASRLIVLHLSIIGEPARGEALKVGSVWNAFITAALATPELAGTAALIRAHIERDGGPLPQWRIEQKHLQTSKRTMVDIGIGPVEGFDETVGIEVIPELEKTKLDQTDRNHRVLVIDEEMAALNP